jgi:hypothetical protein
MGMFDQIKGVPEGYDDQVKLWDCMGWTYQLGDRVPAMGKFSTYSVELRGQEGTCYVHVVDRVIAGVGCPEPVAGAPVFSKWGGPEGEEHPFAIAVRAARERGSG